MNIVRLESTVSTNTWVAQNEETLPTPSFVYCHEQTAGRGQRGNSWESEPGKNITASLFFHPLDFEAKDQFIISEAIALAITEFLQQFGIQPKVKWPNDIYVDDKKICGILVEHSVTGRNITRTIAGFGININQTIFLSNAPNPVSLKILTGLEYDLTKLRMSLIELLEKYLKILDKSEFIHTRFHKLLWRLDGNYYNFYDRKKGENINAKIDSVAINGILSLQTKEGENRQYAFKEVEFII